MNMKMIRAMFILLTLVQTMTDTVYGGDSGTISVSCIIPVIPGVNAPLTDEQTPETTTQAITDENLKPQGEEKPAETPAWLQQETQVVQAGTENGTTQLVTIKTYYNK